MGTWIRHHLRELIVDLLALSPVLLLLAAIALHWTFPRWVVLVPAVILGTTMWRLNGESWWAIATWLLPLEALIAVAAFLIPLPWSMVPLSVAMTFLVIMIFSQRAIEWWRIQVIRRIGN